MTTPIDRIDDLSPQDQRLLDALVECGFDREALEALTPQDQRRADAIMSVFELLDDYPADDADDTLVHATLARIDRAEGERAERLSFVNQVEAGRGRRFRMPDLITIAAVILIGASIVWPLMSHLNERSIDTGCQNNLRRMAFAFDQYANDYNGMMPVAKAGLLSTGSGWSSSTENVVNLKPLIDGGYCERGHLSCPGHDGPMGQSYSYQWVMPGGRAAWSTGRVTLVLGDRNPLIDAARQGRMIPALSVSLNHDGRGQNVLASNGKIVWLEQPVIGSDDNIWLPAGAPFLLRGVKPAGVDDVFLAH